MLDFFCKPVNLLAAKTVFNLELPRPCRQPRVPFRYFKPISSRRLKNVFLITLSRSSQLTVSCSNFSGGLTGGARHVYPGEKSSNKT